MSINQLFEQLLTGYQSGNSPIRDELAKTGSTSNSGGGLMDKMPGGAMGGLAAGGLLGVLLGNKSARKGVGKMAGGAVKVGGAALLGAVAYNAYKNWQAGKSATPVPSNAPTNPLAYDNQQEFARFDAKKAAASDGNPLQVTLIKAMIAAANADGHIDRDEQTAIFDAVNKMELDAEDKALVFDTLQTPPDIKEIAALTNGIEQAAEVYLVSRMAIDPDHPSERAYLDDLAMYLSLPDDLCAHLEAQVVA